MKKILHMIGVVALGSLLSSCLDDKTQALDPSLSTNVVEFKNPAGFSSPFGSKYALYTQAFDVAPENSYPITVSYSGAQVAPEDITVTIGVDAAALTQYNGERAAEAAKAGGAAPTPYDLIPPTLYTLPATVVIPKGQRTATVDLKFKSVNFDFTKLYALPVQIRSISSGTISGNFGTILINVNAKNKYDGVYSSKGTMVDVTNANFKHITQLAGETLEYTLETVSATKCVVIDREYGVNAPAHIFYTGTGASFFGNFGAILEFDPTTNKVIGVTNFYGQPGPAPALRSGVLDPTGVNTYNPTTKTIRVKYSMRQPNVIVAPPNIRVTWDEELTYLRAR